MAQIDKDINRNKYVNMHIDIHKDREQKASEYQSICRNHI